MQYFIYAWCIAEEIKLCINFVLIVLVLLQVELVTEDPPANYNLVSYAL